MHGQQNSPLAQQWQLAISVVHDCQVTVTTICVAHQHEAEKFDGADSGFRVARRQQVKRQQEIPSCQNTSGEIRRGDVQDIDKANKDNRKK